MTELTGSASFSLQLLSSGTPGLDGGGGGGRFEGGEREGVSQSVRSPEMQQELIFSIIYNIICTYNGCILDINSSRKCSTILSG